jgi:broad specificity phosphatase PhoE
MADEGAVTVFHIMRHGQHTLLGQVLAGRTPGIPLSERGREEARWLADRLAGERVSALYSSPIQRTRETAEILAERLRLPVRERAELIELDYGEWTGWTFDQVRGDPRWQSWTRNRSLAALPGGETMREVQKRVVEAFFELAQEHREEVIAIVSHGDVIRAALLFALGMPLDLYARIEIGTGSLSTVRIEDGGMRVLRLNERPVVPG